MAYGADHISSARCQEQMQVINRDRDLRHQLACSPLPNSPEVTRLVEL